MKVNSNIIEVHQSVEAAVLLECKAMIRYLLDEGKTAPAAMVGEWKRIADAMEAGEETELDLATLSEIHGKLSQEVEPALPVALTHIYIEQRGRERHHFLGPIPFFRAMIVVALVLLFSLVGLSLTEAIDYKYINKGIFENSGLSLLLNLLFLVSAAGLGAVFATLHETNKLFQKRRFDPSMAGSYWARLVMGIVAGIILAELVPIGPPSKIVPNTLNSAITKEDSLKMEAEIALPKETSARMSAEEVKSALEVRRAGYLGYLKSQTKSPPDPEQVGEASRGGVLKVVMTVLGGFSVNLLFGILMKMGKALESMVGNEDELMEHLQKLDQKRGQESMQAALPEEDIEEPDPPIAPEIKTRGNTPITAKQPLPTGSPLIDLAQLKAMLPNANQDRLASFLEPLNAAFERYEINKPLRIAHFIAQVGHESSNFDALVEYWPNPQLNDQGIPARGSVYQMNYDGKNGNTQPGDGYKFRGRGLMQLTGRWNYQSYDKYLDKVGQPLAGSLLDNPDQVAQPTLAVDSAAWYWRYSAGINRNEIADRDDIDEVTLRVNGKRRLHLDDRKKRLAIAKKALGIA